MQYLRRTTLLVTVLVLTPGYTVLKEPLPPRRPIPVPKFCVQPTDKVGKVKPDKAREAQEVTPYCPDPEVAQTPTPTKRRRIVK